MNTVRRHEKKQALPDFTLLMSRLERQIVHDPDPSKAVRMLKDERIWKTLSVAQQLKWASLAQAAGELDEVFRVLSHIHKKSPDTAEAWQRHLELLAALDKREAVAKVLALSRQFVDEKIFQKWQQFFSFSEEKTSEADVRAAAAPFEHLRHRQQAVERYMKLFSGREDCFARQWVDKAGEKQGYVPVRRALEIQDIEDHFKGHKTYGIYLLKSNGFVRTALLDVDLRKPFRGLNLKSDQKNQIKREFHYTVERLEELSGRIGLQPLIEFSGGKGYHFWYFFQTALEPKKVRSVLEGIKQRIAGDLSVFSIEVFPKQDHLSGKGFGNLVKLPMGIHRLSGKRSYFVRCHHRTIQAQLDFLSGVRPADSENLKISGPEHENAAVYIHPRLESWAETYPELFALERRCPPLAQIIAACRQKCDLSMREEKILFQTVGFLPRAKTLLHHLCSSVAEYNPHMVDYRLSRVRGTPLGCRRIHSLLSYTGDYCSMEGPFDYLHPLLHLEQWRDDFKKKPEKAGNLSDALENLKAAILQAQRFLK